MISNIGSRKKQIIGLIVLLVLGFLLARYLQNNYAQFASLSFVHPWYVLPLVVLLIILYYFVGLANYYLLLPFLRTVGVWENFFLSIITGFYNLITPLRGGMAVRAVYLKKRHDFAYTDFVTTQAGTYVISFFVAGMLGLISTAIIYSRSGIISPVIVTIFAGVTLSLLVFIIVSPKFSERGHRWLDKVIRVINGWHTIRKDGRMVLIIAVLSALQILLSSWMLLMQFSVFGFTISFAAAVFLTALSSLSFFIQITPGGLGISEAILVFSAATIGITAEQSLAAAILGRLVSVIVLFTLGPLFSWWLLKKKAHIKSSELRSA